MEVAVHPAKTTPVTVVAGIVAPATNVGVVLPVTTDAGTPETMGAPWVNIGVVLPRPAGRGTPEAEEAP